MVLQIEDLGKKYLLSHQQQERYQTLRDAIGNKVRDCGRRLFADAADRQRRAEARRREEFWALREISLNVQQGERVGIIGRNGAGKSTLLKLISRITEPTRGRITIRGRVASLLEVGTGFHPELTGRENIFLNGAILGMGKAEIKRKFDEIVAFSETENFLDTPVKRFSSGMSVRLAFAVAAHLDPEILIIDEVLAVGDTRFQKKCLDKMKAVADAGRTVLFVSHNMGTIRSFCDTGILLDGGQIRAAGKVEEIVEAYLCACADSATSSDLSQHPRQSDTFRIDKLQIVSAHGTPNVAEMGGGLEFRLEYRCRDRGDFLKFSIHVTDPFGNNLAVLSPNQQSPEILDQLQESGVLHCNVPQMNLLPGVYHIDLHVMAGSEKLQIIDRAGSFEVVDSDVYRTGMIPSRKLHGIMFFPATWRQA